MVLLKISYKLHALHVAEHEHTFATQTLPLIRAHGLSAHHAEIYFRAMNTFARRFPFIHWERQSGSRSIQRRTRP